MKLSFVLISLILAVTFSLTTLGQETLTGEVGKARDLIMKGQKEEASAILTKIMESQPDNRQAVQFWLMANMKRTPEGELYAIKQLDSLLVFYPKNTGIIFFKSFILIEHGKNEEGIECINQLIELQPDSSLNYILKGQALSAMQKYEGAFKAFDKATTLDASRFDLWGMKAAVLAKLKHFDEAIIAINKGIDLAPDFPSNIYNRACIYCLMGDKTNALTDLKTAVEKMPRLKQHARKDEDFKGLWTDEEFLNITE
ncbi:tetratricopeptide repeat protein [Prolixibacteraceae bacterium Z1-6]|uniref:Tetratricopeptide repeat protein n=1 Tax=Draconibacterium aestuarii TaxID=2998507 RepID=A0A9X3FEJ0_9BACT|nr:tetratricopeptide repeat protein [Prolixibacteraceae bacterium Z1-6]